MNGTQGGRSSGLDRRTLLAFAIMILLWLVFSRYFMPHPTQQTQQPAPAGEVSSEGGQATTRTSQGQAPAPAAPSAQGAGGAGEPAALGTSGPTWELRNELPASGEDVVVAGPLFRAVFSPKGAVVRSWVLEKYTDATDEPVELIANPENGALGLVLQGPEGLLDLRNTIFALEEGPGSTADQAGIREVTFVAEGVPIAATPNVPWNAEPATASAAPAASPTGAPVRVERVYRIDPSTYDLTMQVRVSGVANFRQDHRLIIDWVDGLPFLEKQRSQELRAKAAMVLLAEQFNKFDYGGGSLGCGCGRGPASQGGQREYEGMLRWAGVRTKYFTALIVPAQESQARVVASSNPQEGEVGISLSLPMADEGPTDETFSVYIGPLDYRIIRGYEQRVHRNVTLIVDMGGKLIAPISKAAHWFLIQVHAVVPNYGVAIIILAVFLRLLFHPLTIKSLRSQRKLQMLKPELDKLNEQYKDSPELRAKKTMEFHKKHGVSPLSGCLPLLIQMPVIYALYALLMNAIELRKAPFVLWIDDLAAPDRVAQIAGIPIHVLPLLMAGTMFWQQKMTPTDPRQAPMLLLMPLFMVLIFYSLPSGLVLYWTVTNLLTMGQQMAMKPEQLITEPLEVEEPRPQRKGKTRRG